MADNENDSGGIGSAIGSIVTAAPAIAGGISTAGRIRSAWEDIASVTDSGHIPQAHETIKKFASEYLSENNNRSWKQGRYLREIETLAENSQLSVSQIREIVHRIASKADPTGGLSAEVTSRLADVKSSQEALGSMHKYLETHNTVYSNRATRMLAGDLGKLSKRIGEGLSIETTSWTGRIPRIKSTLKPSQWESKLGSKMAADLEKIREMTGAKIGVSVLKRADIAGEELQLSLSGGKLSSEIKLKIPRVLRGQYQIQSGPLAGMGTVIKSGSTQQSKRIAGVYGLINQGVLVESFNHEEWMLRRAQEELIPHVLNNNRLSRREISRATREFESRMRATADWVPSVKNFEGVEKYIQARSPVMHLYEHIQDITPRYSKSPIDYLEKYETANVSTLANLIESGGAELPNGEVLPLYPGSGPTQAAGGIAALVDPRQGAGLMPSSVPTSRRPLAAIKPNWAPTASAIEAISSNPFNEEFLWAARGSEELDPVVGSPMLRARFISSKHQHLLEGTGVHAEGQFLLSTKRSAELAVDELSQIKIDASRIGSGISDLINLKSGKAHWDINQGIEEGAFLGYSPEGSLIEAKENMKLLHATIFGDAEEGTMLRIATTKRLEHINFAKYQGHKATAALTPAAQIVNVLGQLKDPHSMPMPGEEIDLLMTMDELRKNRSMHYNQMFTSLWEINNERMQMGKKWLPEVSAFQADPRNWINQIEDAALTMPVAEQDPFKMRQISTLAKQSYLDPGELADVFGAVPEAMEDLGGIKALGEGWREAELSAIQNSVSVRGVTQLFFAGAGPETGAGSRASLEPRTMELLQGPAWGELGPQVQEDIMKRMVATYPERLFEQKELMTSLGSMEQLTSRGEGMTPTELMKATGKHLLPDKGTNLKISGVGDVYIPGSSTIKQLASYQTPSGKAIDMPLAHAYKDLIETASSFEQSNVTREVLNKKLDEVASLTGQAALGTVTKKGGLLRNKISGSSYLRAEDIAIGMDKLEADVGLSPKMGARMFKEMGEMGIYNPLELIDMQERFEAGQVVSGVMQRDPSIGPHSVQAVTMQKVENAERAAIFREQRFKAFATAGTGGENFAAEAAAAFAAGKGSDLRISPLVGMAGDFDADNVALMFAGPHLEESLRRKAGNTMEYESYIIRQQMMKAKAASAVVEAGEEMAGTVYSLSVTGGKQLGRLSNRLQEYRAGVLMGAGGLSQKEGLNSLSLLEWLEQVPISAKHIKKGQESTVLQHLSDIESALSNRDSGRLAASVDKVMAEAKDPNRAMMFGGGKVALQDTKGAIRTMDLEGIDLINASKNAIRAREAMDASPEGKMLTSRVRQLFFDKGPRMRAEEAFDILSPEFAKKSIFGSLIQGGREAVPKGPMSTLTTKALAAKNRMGALGKGMLEHAKPLALGLGVSMGLSMLLSEPPRVLEAGANIPPQPNLKSGSGGENVTNVHPDDRVSGNPTVPSMTSFGQTARVGSNSGHNINLKTNSGNKVDYSNLSNQMRSLTGGKTRIATNIRDQRSSLTPQKLSGILRGD